MIFTTTTDPDHVRTYTLRHYAQLDKDPSVKAVYDFSVKLESCTNDKFSVVLPQYADQLYYISETIEENFSSRFLITKATCPHTYYLEATAGGVSMVGSLVSIDAASGIVTIHSND